MAVLCSVILAVLQYYRLTIYCIRALLDFLVLFLEVDMYTLKRGI
jgi:hypothetical protein